MGSLRVLDSCWPVGTFWRIMLPLARPCLAAVAVIKALPVWNEYLMALVLFNTDDLIPVQRGMTKFVSAETPRQRCRPSQSLPSTSSPNVAMASFSSVVDTDATLTPPKALTRPTDAAP
ncbi:MULTISPECIES: hypothetical protein [unclassified Kribbella]|uniref:hypothetical protein n=1 Tax=unclassified Kribbella TaxID=2644121 RepID=UPI0033EA991F